MDAAAPRHEAAGQVALPAAGRGGDDGEAVVFERRLGPWRALGLVGLGLLAPAALAGLWRHHVVIRDLVEALGAPFGQVTSAGALAALAVAPVAAFVLALRLAARRFGRCVAGPDWLEVVPGHLPAWWARLVVRRDEVVERVPGPRGVRLRAADGARGTIPTASPEALDAALAEVDRPLVDPPVSAGGRRPGWTTALVAGHVVVVVGAAIGLSLALGRRFDPDLRLVGAVTVALLALPLGLCLHAALVPYRRRVHVGRRGVAVGEVIFGYDALEQVSVGQGAIACVAGGWSCVAWVGSDEAAVREALERRLRQAGRQVDEVLGPLPAWASAWRRRLRACLRGGPAFVVPLALVALGWTAPNETVQRYMDVHGQALYVVEARDVARPIAVVLGPPGATIRTAGWWPLTLAPAGEASGALIDLRRGIVRRPDGLDQSFVSAATFVRIGEAEIEASRATWTETPNWAYLRDHYVSMIVNSELTIRGMGSGIEGLSSFAGSAPALLEQLAGWSDDPLLEAAALGWTTRRCFYVPAVDEGLAWGVDQGEVAFVVRTRLRGWRVEGAGIGYELEGHWGRVIFELTDGPLAVRLDDFGTFTEDPTLPTDHATLLAVRAKVLAGATLAQALDEARR